MNFNSTFKEDYILYRNIDLPWEQVDADLASIATDQTRVMSIVEKNEYVNDELRKLTSEYLKYGYTAHNTKIWKTTNGESKLTFAWEKDIIDQLPLDRATATLTRQDPGQVLPWHIDRFFFLKKQYPEDPRPIWRFLLFMEDWRMGHILQINDSVLHHWRRGDVVVFHPGTEHLSANVGLETKWTCNITGFLNQ